MKNFFVLSLVMLLAACGTSYTASTPSGSVTISDSSTAGSLKVNGPVSVELSW
jgi:hypothetical protein